MLCAHCVPAILDQKGNIGDTDPRCHHSHNDPARTLELLMFVSDRQTYWLCFATANRFHTSQHNCTHKKVSKDTALLLYTQLDAGAAHMYMITSNCSAQHTQQHILHAPSVIWTTLTPGDNQVGISCLPIHALLRATHPPSEAAWMHVQWCNKPQTAAPQQ